MNSTQNSIYFLAPNWTCRPHTITLGTIVDDPFRANDPLSNPSAETPLPKVETIPETDWRLSAETPRTVNLNVWAQFLENVNLTDAANRDTVKAGHFTMKSLDTLSFRESPSPGQIASRYNEAVLKASQKPDRPLSKSLYMVTSLNLARGFGLEGMSSTSAEASHEAVGSTEAEAEVDTKGRISEEDETSGDVVFSYQLMRIQPKGSSKEDVQLVTDLITTKEIEEVGDNVQIAKLDTEGGGETSVAFEKSWIDIF